MEFNETVVKRCRVDYLVKDIQKTAIRVDGNEVDQISNNLSYEVDKKEIAIILASITVAMTTYSDERSYCPMNEDTKIRAMTELLNHFDTELLSKCFEELKYYEIKNIFESDDPVMALHEVL